MMHTLYGFGAPQWPQSVSGSMDMLFCHREVRLRGALIWTNDQSRHRGFGALGIHLFIRISGVVVMV